MPEYSWHRRPSRHFGRVWVPVAWLSIRDSSGRFNNILVQVDTGATISLFKRGVADLLGVELKAGRKIDLGGVGGGRVDAYVHELVVRFGSGVEVQAPIAIADRESVPNLLGRLGIIDQFDLALLAAGRTTRISKTPAETES